MCFCTPATDKNLVFGRRAGTQRCAGEGELVSGLNEHGATVLNATRAVKSQILSIFNHSWPSNRPVSRVRSPKRGKGSAERGGAERMNYEG